MTRLFTTNERNFSTSNSRTRLMEFDGKVYTSCFGLTIHERKKFGEKKFIKFFKPSDETDSR